MQLQDFAQVVRSKNAGPRRFTLDVIFRSVRIISGQHSQRR